ncbi:Uncharacterised protein [Vibrio cholerae]|nr:Uncharacterised protein [Vibrio cholerae]
MQSLTDRAKQLASTLGWLNATPLAHKQLIIEHHF